MIDLQKLASMKIIMHGNVYVVNWGLDSELKVWAMSEDEAAEIFRAFFKPVNHEVFSIDKLEDNVVRFAI